MWKYAIGAARHIRSRLCYGRHLPSGHLLPSGDWHCGDFYRNPPCLLTLGEEKSPLTPTKPPHGPFPSHLLCSWWCTAGVAARCGGATAVTFVTCPSDELVTCARVKQQKQQWLSRGLSVLMERTTQGWGREGILRVSLATALPPTCLYHLPDTQHSAWPVVVEFNRDSGSDRTSWFDSSKFAESLGSKLCLGPSENIFTHVSLWFGAVLSGYVDKVWILAAFFFNFIFLRYSVSHFRSG